MNNVPPGDQPVEALDELLPEYDLDYSKARPNRFAASGTPGERTSSLGEQIKLARDQITQFARDRELAAAKVAEINSLIEQVHVSKFLEAGAIVVGNLLYSVSNLESEIETLTRAAIKVPGGLGIVSVDVPYWGDSEEASAPYDFTPYVACDPPIQAQLLPEIDSLFTNFVRTKVDKTAQPTSTVEEITAAISRLPAAEVGRIRAWLADHDERQWDEQIARDEQAGRLDAMTERALREHQAGKTRPL